MGIEATTHNDATMTRQETQGDLRLRLGVTPRTMQRHWRKAFGESYDTKAYATRSQVATMEALFSGGEITAVVKGVYKGESKRRPDAKVCPVLHPPKPEPEPEKPSHTKTWALWITLALSLGCSVPNMYEITLAIKGSEIKAVFVTAAFTISPFLLIVSGIGRVAHVAAYLVICLEVFCNAASFYGGMTGLSTSAFIAPTTFLHMVTSMIDRPYEITALVISLMMAAGIAVLATVSVYNLQK